MIHNVMNLPDKVVLETDVCIIGSGAGGSVTAAVLAEAGRKVVVLEEGGYYTKENFNRDVLDMMKMMYRRSGATATVGNVPISLTMGVTLGGTTTVNSGTCFKTPPKVLKEWEWTYGVVDASPERMAPYFDQVEEILEVQPVREEILGENSKMVRRGAEILGLSHGPLRRNANKNCSGCGVCCFGCPSDGKRPMHLTYIPRAVSKGADFYPNCEAKEFIVHGRKIEGLRGKFNKPNSAGKVPTMEVRAKVFVLSAGAIYSPAFLLKQKLCNSSGQVGRNLTIHPASRVGAMFDEPIYGWKGVPQGYYVDEYAGDGIMLEGAHGPPALMSVSVPGVGRRFKELVSDITHYADFGVMVSDTGHGRVVLGPAGAPVMLYNLNKEDTRRMVKGMALTCAIFLAAGATEVFPAIWKFPALKSMKDVQKLREAKVKPSDIECGAFHPLGTCRMGEDPQLSVVNSYLKAHDIDNLYIVDGSVFPSSLGVNPQETIMAFAHRTAEHIANTEFK